MTQVFHCSLLVWGLLPDWKVPRQGDLGLNRDSDSDKQTQLCIKGGGLS